MGEWTLDLVRSMNNPTLQVYADDQLVIIRDKYPKSKYHYLVLPKKNIESIHTLNSSHLSTLNYMESKAREYLRGHDEGIVFWLGYHALPSLSRLHLHLISDDFKSDCLKTAKHWNSFTTRFFLPSTKIIKDIEDYGSVQLDNRTKLEALLKKELRCHKCSLKPAHMPALKRHIAECH